MTYYQLKVKANNGDGKAEAVAVIVADALNRGSGLFGVEFCAKDRFVIRQENGTSSHVLEMMNRPGGVAMVPYEADLSRECINRLLAQKLIVEY